MKSKTELVGEWAKKHGISKAVAKEMADSLLLGIVNETLQNGGSVSFKGIGSFKAHDSKARDGRNPATGKSIKIPAKRTVKFKLADGLVQQK